MKFLKYMTILAAAPMMWACSADEGSEPGTDPNPAVTVYTYEPKAEGTNPDNDVDVRFVTNNKVTSLKYLVAPSAEIEATINNGGENALRAKVESEGTAINNIEGNYADVTLTGLFGEYTIAAVANGSTLGNLMTFTGLEWEKKKEGVFVLGETGAPIAGIEEVEASLEVCTTDDTLYRIKDVFGTGTSLKMYMLDAQDEDPDGVYTMFRVRPTATPWTYGDYGSVSVRDIGYWQGNEAFVTNPNYCSGMYEDCFIFFCIQWYVAAGNLGYGYSYFVPYD